MLRIAINGCGRIGRSFLRSYLMDPAARGQIQIVAMNVGPVKKETIAHMVRYDSCMGTLPYEVNYADGTLMIDGIALPLIAVMQPCDADWQRFDVDWVVEATGFFTSKEKAMGHITAGAQRVLITAPSKDADVTIVCGVNDAMFDPQKHTIVSLASCTTNALAPMIKIIDEQFGIASAMMTTIHAYTNNQLLLDGDARDLRQARSATSNIIPTATGASAAIAQVYPAVAGKITGMSVRVPIAKVSLVDLAVVTKHIIDIDAVHAAFRAAAQGNMHGIIATTDLPLVSVDYAGNAHSVIIDELLTQVCGTTMVQLFGWYDNEFAYACRIKDFLLKNVGSIDK